MPKVLHICCFGSSLDTMNKKDRKSLVAVLRHLREEPRFSAFEVDQRLARTLDALKKHKFIRYPEPQPDYPWAEAEVTVTGKKYLYKHETQTEKKRMS